MNAQQAAVALFQFWEKRGFIISNAIVKRHLRDMKFSFRDSDVVIWLEGFRRVADKDKQEKIDALRQKRAQAGPTLAQAGPGKSSTQADFGPTLAQAGPTLRARNKVSLVSEATETNTTYLSPAAPQQTVLIPSPNGEVSKKPKRVPSERDLKAYRILDDAWDVVSEFVALGCTKTDWKSMNKRGALQLVDAEHQPSDVVELLLVAYTHPVARKFHGGMTSLLKLVEHWPKLQKYAMDESECRPANAMLPDVYEHGGKSFDRRWREWQPGDPEEATA